MRRWLWILLICVAGVSCQKRNDQIRLGYLPNLTHSQALVGLHQKAFEKRFEGLAQFSARMFPAGPSVIEALFANEIDLAYVGPSPAINAFIRSHGEFVIISGAANGGGALLVPAESHIKTLDDFKGKRVLTPQLGNSQDVAARTFFTENGLTVDSSKGDVQVLPVPNPDHINLFLKKDVDASWTVEPWVSRLIHETSAQILLEESDVWYGWTKDSYSTTVLVVRRSLLKEKPEWVDAFLDVHVSLTEWMNAYPREAMVIVNDMLEEKWGRPLDEKTLASAWGRIDFTWNLSESSLERGAENAKRLGFLRGGSMDLSGLVFDQPLLTVLIKKNQQA